MVGARKTNRCEQCRQRKIKCDESWPRCLQCHRSNRECSGPPQRHQFVEADDSGQSDSSINVERHETARNVAGHTSVMLELGRTMSVGGLFHKMQLVPKGVLPTQESVLPAMVNERAQHSEIGVTVPAQIQPVDVDDLARALTTSLRIHPREVNLYLLGPFMHYVAPRLGQNRALDDAVRFCLASHANLLRTSRNIPWLDPGSYGIALQSLRAALNDPAQVSTPETVCATVIVQSIDMACNVTSEEGARANAKGLAHLIEAMGPTSLEDSLSFYLALWSHRIISKFAFHTNNDVFLLKPTWVERFVAKSQSRLLDMTTYRVHRQLAAWAALRQFMEAWKQGYPDAASLLVRHTRSIAAELKAIESVFLYHFQGGRGIVQRPATMTDAITTTTYFVDEDELARSICIHAMLTIIMNRIEVFFASHGDADVWTFYEQQNLAMSERIWRLLDFAKQRQPLGHSFYTMCLVISYESASDTQKGLILGHLNELEVSGSEIWTEEKIEHRYLAASGRPSIV